MSWESWGDRLKKHMKEAGVTQETAAEALGVSQGTIAHWLKGRREINLSDFFRLARAAKADPAALLFGETLEGVAIHKLQKFLDENPALQLMLSKTPSLSDPGADVPTDGKGRRKDIQ